jgi:hypothetical protein
MVWVWFYLNRVVYNHARPLVIIHLKLKLPSMIASQVHRYRASSDFTELYLLFMYWKAKPPSHFLYCVCVITPMGPVVRIEPNGSQSLLSHNDAISNIQEHGWESFIQKFEGYNLAVVHAFT